MGAGETGNENGTAPTPSAFGNGAECDETTPQEAEEPGRKTKKRKSRMRVKKLRNTDFIRDAVSPLRASVSLQQSDGQPGR